ncbi:MAG TPA: hypothetical protein VJ783_29255 [Pirellulales bacterium]|nr:hypothetical protein [Pirellulales bacterium]
MLACISALCLSAAAFANGLAEARESKSGVPLFIGWMVAWLMVGAGVGFLFSNRVVVAFLGAVAVFALLVVFGFLLTR